MGKRTCYLFASSTSSMHIPSAASAALLWKHAVKCSGNRQHFSECGQLRYELIVQQQSIGAIFTTAWHCMDHVLKAQVLQCIGMHPLLLHLRKHAKYYRVVFSSSTNHKYDIIWLHFKCSDATKGFTLYWCMLGSTLAHTTSSSRPVSPNPKRYFALASCFGSA